MTSVIVIVSTSKVALRVGNRSRTTVRKSVQNKKPVHTRAKTSQKPCDVEGCANMSYKGKRFCRDHVGPSRRSACGVDGCTKFATSKHEGVCTAHGGGKRCLSCNATCGYGMVQCFKCSIVKRCQSSGCKRPQHDVNTEYCGRHQGL